MQAGPPNLIRMVQNLVANLGWVDLDLGSSPALAGGSYCSYLLPKQDGGTSQI